MVERIPFGYEMINREVKIIPEEANIIRYVFEEFVILKNKRKVFAELISNNIYRRSSKWTVAYVSSTLKNVKYIGDNLFPQIVSAEIFMNVQELLEETRNDRILEGIMEIRGIAYSDKLMCGYERKSLYRRTYSKARKWYCYGRVNTHKLCEQCTKYIDIKGEQIELYFIEAIRRLSKKKIAQPCKYKNTSKFRNIKERYETAIECSDVDSEILSDLVYKLTESEYEMIEDKSDEIIKYYISGIKTFEKYDGELLNNIVRQIYVKDKEIEFEFINGQIIKIPRKEEMLCR